MKQFNEYNVESGLDPGDITYFRSGSEPLENRIRRFGRPGCQFFKLIWTNHLLVMETTIWQHHDLSLLNTLNWFIFNETQKIQNIKIKAKCR